MEHQAVCVGLLGAHNDMGIPVARSFTLQERTAGERRGGHSPLDGGHLTGLHPVLWWSLGDYLSELHYLASSGVHPLLYTFP